jgi:ATP-binding protein involved in chromosome partitioning
MSEKDANLSKKFIDQITPKTLFKKNKINGVKKIIAISSGKGGVGKSTIAVNLAIALKNLKYNVGILDADIYGPSIPKMMGILEKPKSEDGVNLIPIKKFNIQCMSIGFMVSEETPMIWRGPMVSSTIKTFTGKVLWENIDFLIIDMPPGTGDALLTFSQEIDIDGAVIITTPQDIAIIDVKRGIEMFKKTKVKILGIIENMTSFTSGDGVEHFIFGKDGGKNISSKFNIELLGQIPIDINLRKNSDEGLPFVDEFKDHKVSKLFLEIANKITKIIS